MSKKILIAIAITLVVVVIAGFWVSETALAKDGDTLLRRIRRARPTLGQVTEITDSGFSLLKRDGGEQSFLVDENTRFFDRDKNELTFDDVQVDRWVAVAAPKGVDEPVARFVILIPEDFDPSKMSAVRGTVMEIDLARQTFTLENRQGEVTTLFTDEETIFRGLAEDLADLKEGVLASAIFEEMDDGSLLGRLVRSRYPMTRKGGEITAVDEGAGTFTLVGQRDGEDHTFVVDENTRFRGKDGSVQSLADLQVGMVAIVTAKQIPSDGGGEWVAVSVASADRDDLPEFEVKMIGKVLSVGSSSFTIQGRDGQEYTIQVTDETRFRGRRVRLSSLDDLKKGMWVFVGGTDFGDGTFQAELVWGGRRGR